ncbi:MAG: hypothetical protein SO238_07805 [Treponema sp.]|nr:hypothetical protein [Treponema sp.]
MYTLGELADELNRQEWAVERMLKNRGYLKIMVIHENLQLIMG